MLNSLPIRILWHSFNWLTRFIIATSALMTLLVVLLILSLRYWLLPNIGLYHDSIATSLAGAIGNPVTIGKIESDWSGLQPRLGLYDVHILNGEKQSALVLPHIEGALSWSSLLAMELRLSSLEIDRPELLIRRDAKGQVFIGGLAFSPKNTDHNMADWLLHQSHMVVRDAIIVWIDEGRDTPPLVLQQVNLRIESLFSHHRFALRAAPPAELATPLDLRGDFYGANFDDFGAWRGQLYARLDYTDVATWRHWMNLPEGFIQGLGALRCWLYIEDGKVNGITADLGLRDVVARLSRDLPEMKLLDMRGRAIWKKVTSGMEVSTKDLTVRLQNGVSLQPTNLYFRTVTHEKIDYSELRANLLQLESLAGLANFLPLPADLRAKLGAYAPGGKVSNLELQWQGNPEHDYKILNYKIKAKFENLAVHQVGSMPGLTGLSADVDGSDAGGRLKINTHQLVVDAPGVMREPLLFATLTGQANWQHKNGELWIYADKVAISNDDLAGVLQGSYQTKAGTLGILDLTASLTRGDIRRTARYTPLVAVSKGVSDWLHDALLAGHTEDLHIRIKGNLSDFPLDSREKALFEIGGHAQDVVLKFGREWPRIDNISGEFLLHGNTLQVKSPQATMLDATLQDVSVMMPDMASSDLPLEIRGEALASSNTFLKFIQASPVRGYIDGFTDDMSATGNGHLDLFLLIPLAGDKPVKVSGMLRVQDNDIDLGAGVPVLKNTHGELAFTESGMQASDVQAEILGGASSINVQTGAGGTVHATVHGRSNLDVLKKLSPHPLLSYLYGGAAWDADISVVKKTAKVTLSSNLQGLGSSLPQPLSKAADDVLPLRLEKRNAAEGRDVIVAQLGKLLGARLVRQDENGEMVIKRGIINFGGEVARPDPQLSGARPERGRTDPSTELRTGSSTVLRTGVRLTGSLPVLSLQGWSGLLEAGAGSGFPFAGADIVVGKVNGAGMIIDNLHIEASLRGDGLFAQLTGDTLNGEVEWQPRGEGKLTAHLQNLLWSSSPTQTPAKASSATPGNLPAMQIAIDNFQYENKQIGRLELVGHPDGRDWRLRRLNIVNPDGSLTGDGIWQGDKSQINLMLQISDAGKILERSGYPNTVKGGSGKLAALLSWTGDPGDFNYATLDGSLKLDTNKGQFLKMDPGIGKLLGILSLQALPKRITLDFTDVFSDGFQFDNINGNASIKKGMIDTQDFHIDGSSAKVTMKGSVDLNSETQNLHVKILPTLGESVSVIGAFAAGPLAGIGSLIINKVLGNPLDKLASFEYNISGSWSDPKVVKVGAAPVKPNNQGK